MGGWPGSRRAFIALALGTILLGLLLQRIGALLPPPVADILGDALWAAMIAWLAGAIAPSAPRWRRGLAALVFCWCVELSQRYHAPLIDAWRATRLGHLVLGTDFDPRDLAAYALGVIGACLLEPLLLRGRAATEPGPGVQR